MEARVSRETSWMSHESWLESQEEFRDTIK